MRPAFYFSRFYFRNGIRSRFQINSTFPFHRRIFAQFKSHTPRKLLQRAPPTGTVLLAILTPTALVQISEESRKDGESSEIHMLEASRKELEDEASHGNATGVNKIWHDFVWILDTYIYEPIATGLRFLHLVMIFVPVIVTVPVIFVGRRQVDRDNERTGTIWWYGFLVSSMERAGAAFIKV
jgi:aarF domain-containing kinase